jgi:heme-degrading monooxygenase HmoA
MPIWRLSNRPPNEKWHVVKLDAAIAYRQITVSGFLGRTPRGNIAILITVFRSRLKPGLTEEYNAAVQRMSELAETMPGYISHKTFFAEDGERCTIVEFEHEAGLRTWRTNAEHLAAQKNARLKYYTVYSAQVCTLERESKFNVAEPEVKARA